MTLRYTTPHYIQQLWLRWPLQPLQKAQLQPPFGPSVVSRCHPCITTTHLSYSVLYLKLPPPTCAVLLAVFIFLQFCIIKGSLEVKLPTIWTDGKAEVGRVREEKVRRKKIREEKESEEKNASARKGRKVAKHCVFQCAGSGGLKRRVRSHLRTGEMKNCTLLWREARIRSQNVQNTLFIPVRISTTEWEALCPVSRAFPGWAMHFVATAWELHFISFQCFGS